MNPVVEVRDLHKIYATPGGPVPVLTGVDWSIAAGEFCAITGPSGSGKTTLLNLITLLDTPTRGEILIEGRALTPPPMRPAPGDLASPERKFFSRARRADEAARTAVRRDKIGMIFQKFCLLPHRTALDNVLFRARYLRADRADMLARARALLDQLGLTGQADRPARLLSGGEMQRVAIARALLIPPALLVADEPTGNLDRAAAETVMAALTAVHRAGTPVLLVTHNPTLLPYATTHYTCREGRLWRET